MYFRRCFCNLMIESSQVNPCDLNILINCDKSKEEQDNQTFYCHVECFREKLHKEVEGYLIVDVLEDA
jgi:hypothetical protein